MACHTQCTNVEIIEMLLEAGADPSMLDHGAYNSLHNCAISNCVKYVHTYIPTLLCLCV